MAERQSTEGGESTNSEVASLLLQAACILRGQPDSSGYSVKFLRTESGLNQAVAYIRPLQTDLDTRACEPDECQEVVLEKCQTCGKNISLQSLSQHIQQCTRETLQPATDYITEGIHQSADTSENVQEPLPSTTVPHSASVCTYSLQDILKSLQMDIDMDEAIRFNINGTHVWNGAVRAMRRPNFSVKKRVDVKFTDDGGNSEGAVDCGGPMREFFRLALQHIRESPMFTGPDYQRVLSCHAPSLRDSSYFYAGQLVAMSIVHGGPSPHFFAPVLYQALVSGSDNVQADIEDLHDHEAKSWLSEILASDCKENLSKAVDKCENLLLLAGCLRNITLDNKKEVVQDVINCYVLQRTRAPFERFQDGLRSCGLLDAVRAHPTIFKSLFTKGDLKLTAEIIEKLFRENRSECGSNKFQRENEAVCHWRDYLLDAEMGLCSATLKDILIFATGSDNVPALGFDPTPTLEFLHDNSRFPEANTRSNILRIPFKESYEYFVKDMDFGIKNSPGFGMA
ncbi:hypothetical protein GJAV_G00015150 [Gymnothorax javanicus]|nr:hypothetical protein GJAV_G00015150 [Gymnothorax javanicus]